MSSSLHTRRAKAIRLRAAIRLCVQFSWVIVSVALIGCTDQPEKTTPTAPTSIHSPSPITSSTPSARLEPTPTVELASAGIAGTWVGGYKPSDGAAKEQLLTITFAESPDHLEGQLEIAQEGTSSPLSSVTLKGGALHFEWMSGNTGEEAAIFEGHLSGHTITGTVQRGSTTGPFAFVRSEEPAQDDYAQFAGTYRFPSGRAIGFYQTSGPKSQVFATILLYADLQTGELAAAFPISGTTFAVGSAVGLAYPFRAEATFVRDTAGNVSSVTWDQKDLSETNAGKLTVNIDEVKYQAKDGIALAGRLSTPNTPGKHPAVVIVQGAGKVTRQRWLTDLLGGLFALDGIATLSYDKRGVGDSGGVYASGIASQQNIELLAGDALVGLDYLKSRSDIDPAHIGMQGQSQAGWIIPFAAAQSSDVAFMVLWSGPGVTQGISDLYDQIAETTDRDQVTTTLLNTPPTGYDPVLYLEKTSAPGFWAYGARDMTVPVPESIANLEKVRAAGQKDFTWQTFPEADHYLFRVASPTGDDLRLSLGYPPGMLDAMMKWLRQHISVK